MVTLAFAQMAYFVFHDTKLGGGTDGIYLYVEPVLAIGGCDAGRPRQAAAVLLLRARRAGRGVYGLLALLLRSRFGRALAGIRVNEQRMRAAGFSDLPLQARRLRDRRRARRARRLPARRVKDGFVNPELLAWHESGAVLLMIILGGLGHLRGAVIGAFAFALLQELFQSRGAVRRASPSTGS